MSRQCKQQTVLDHESMIPHVAFVFFSLTDRAEVLRQVPAVESERQNHEDHFEDEDDEAVERFTEPHKGETDREAKVDDVHSKESETEDSCS